MFKSGVGNNYKYKELGSLFYRQTTGGIKIVWNHVKNTYWVFMKEISSDGDVSTVRKYIFYYKVDVIYPAAPLFMIYNPEIFRRLMVPIFVYAKNETLEYG